MTKLTYEDREGRYITRKGWFLIGGTALVFGLAAVVWAAAVHDWAILGIEHRATRRAENSVGEPDPPKAGIALSVHSGAACLVDGTGHIDGEDVWFYITNKCGYWMDHPEYLYHVEAQDGTVIESGTNFFSGAEAFSPHERREQKITITASDRATAVEVWTIDGKAE
jgi:hypothetical protein